MKIDFLTVCHNDQAAYLFNLHARLFLKRCSGLIDINFIISCNSDSKKYITIPNVTIYDYEPISGGSIDHAYNMHTLILNSNSKWFCMMDPDVYPMSKDWDRKIINLFEKYDAFGIPYAKDQKPNRFYDFPMVHLLFFNRGKFDSEIENSKYKHKKEKNLNILTPCTSNIGLINRLNSEPFKKYAKRPDEIDVDSICMIANRENGSLIEYFNMYTVDKKEPTADTGWRMPVIFKNLKTFCFFEEKLKQIRKKGIKHNNIILDPGIGFGKNLKHNITLINQISIFHSLGFPIMLGLVQ